MPGVNTVLPGVRFRGHYFRGRSQSLSHWWAVQFEECWQFKQVSVLRAFSSLTCQRSVSARDRMRSSPNSSDHSALCLQDSLWDLASHSSAFQTSTCTWSTQGANQGAVSDSEGLGRRLRFCISMMLPSGADSSGPQTAL